MEHAHDDRTVFICWRQRHARLDSVIFGASVEPEHRSGSRRAVTEKPTTVDRVRLLGVRSSRANSNSFMLQELSRILSCNQYVSGGKFEPGLHALNKSVISPTIFARVTRKLPELVGEHVSFSRIVPQKLPVLTCSSPTRKAI